MERLRKDITVKRQLFPRAQNQLVILLDDPEPVAEQIQLQLEILQERYDSICDSDTVAFKQIMDEDYDEN